jgi:hypothetical protein
MARPLPRNRAKRPTLQSRLLRHRSPRRSIIRRTRFYRTNPTFWRKTHAIVLFSPMPGPVSDFLKSQESHCRRRRHQPHGLSARPILRGRHIRAHEAPSRGDPCSSARPDLRCRARDRGLLLHHHRCHCDEHWCGSVAADFDWFDRCDGYWLGHFAEGGMKRRKRMERV